jgi:hypothetical protein
MTNRPNIRPRIPPCALPLLCCLAVAVGCDSRQLLAPGLRTPAAPAMESSDDASVIGAATVAPENTGGVPVGPVSDSTWVVVQVSGQFDARANPECAAQPPNWPCIFNSPASNFYEPAPFTSGPVQAWVVSTRTRQVPLRGTGGAANTAGQAVGLYFGEAPGSLVVLSAMQNFGTQNPNPVGPVSSWMFSGEYNATARRIPNPLTFSGGPTGDAGGAVTFTVETTAPLLFINPVGVPASAPPGSVDWYFVPGDSVPLEYERTSQAWQVFSCWLRTTCTVTPPANLNGRMQVVAYVEGRLVIGRSDYVRAKPSPKLELRCTPNTVKRYDGVVCEVTARPGGSLKVSKWWFDDGHGHIVRPSDPEQDSAFYWGGRMVVSGTVHVEGKIDDRVVPPDSAIITVEPRTWSFSYPAEPPHTFDRGDSLPYPPVTQYGQKIGDGVLGRFYGGRFRWGWVTIPRGPNEGFAVMDVPPSVVTPLLIVINAGGNHAGSA